MAKLTAKQLTELGDGFLLFAQAVGNYRYSNSTKLTKAQNQQIRDFHWTLLNYADDLYTTSATIIIDDVSTSLDTLRLVTEQINDTYQTLTKIQKAIDVAAAGITLGAALFSKDPQVIAKAISGLVTEWNK